MKIKLVEFSDGSFSKNKDFAPSIMSSHRLKYAFVEFALNPFLGLDNLGSTQKHGFSYIRPITSSDQELLVI